MYKSSYNPQLNKLQGGYLKTWHTTTVKMSFHTPLTTGRGSQLGPTGRALRVVAKCSLRITKKTP